MAEPPEELRPILHDVNTASPVRVLVCAPPPGDRHAAAFWLAVAGTSGHIGFTPAPGDDLVELMSRAADQLHDWILECLPELGLPAVWPECPEHPARHPLQVDVRDRVAVWVCPHTGTGHARVGDLRA
jgi:hypothetical protein